VKPISARGQKIPGLALHDFLTLTFLTFNGATTPLSEIIRLEDETMANNEATNDVSQQVRQTLSDATDLTYGADNAAARLQTDVYQNYQLLGGGPAYKAYLDQVTATLAHNPTFPEVGLCANVAVT